MNNKHRIPVFAALLSTSLAAGAQEVYEKKNPQGVVEFSDQPSEGAKPVAVQPNVVDTAPVKSLAPSAPSRAAKPKAPSGSMPPAVEGEEVVGDVYDGYDTRREEARVRHQEKATRMPAHRVPARAPAAPAAGHRR